MDRRQLRRREPLIFGSASADAVVDFVDRIDLGTGTAATVREVRVLDNAATTADRARLSAALSGAAAFTLDKTGPGVLELGGANAYAGPTSVSAGTLLVNGSTGTGAVTVKGGAALGGRAPSAGPSPCRRAPPSRPATASASLTSSPA